MSSRPRLFFLKRFPGEECGDHIGIRGSVAFRRDLLSVRWTLFGDLSKTSIPPPTGDRERKGHLWEDTCLELFLAADGAEGYWEFNLSPAGSWNVYRFVKYRTGMREEPAFPTLPFVAEMERDELRLSADLHIGRIVPRGIGLAIGVAAVIRAAGGGTSHWALFHPGLKPDFHRRDGFLLRIPPS